MPTTEAKTTYNQGHSPLVTANHSSRTATKDAAFLLPHIKPHHHILDIGCGPGSITVGLAAFVPQGSVTGIDLSTTVIAQATSHLNSQSPVPENVRFETGDVVNGLRFADAEFDIVFCNQTLIHIPTPVVAMREMQRVCKSGGGFVACREGDWPSRFYPELPGLFAFMKYQFLLINGPLPLPSPGGTQAVQWSSTHPSNAPHPPGTRSGSQVHVWARQVGFDPARIEKGASVHVVATPEARRTLAENMVARIEKAGHGERFREMGASGEEVEGMVRDLARWAEDVDGWYGIVNCEVLCWV